MLIATSPKYTSKWKTLHWTTHDTQWSSWTTIRAGTPSVESFPWSPWDAHWQPQSLGKALLDMAWPPKIRFILWWPFWRAGTPVYETKIKTNKNYLKHFRFLLNSAGLPWSGLLNKLSCMMKIRQPRLQLLHHHVDVMKGFHGWLQGFLMWFHGHLPCLWRLRDEGHPKWLVPSQNAPGRFGTPTQCNDATSLDDNGKQRQAITGPRRSPVGTSRDQGCIQVSNKWGPMVTHSS